MRLAPVEDAGGRARGLLVIVRDITARRREQDALRESEARFHSCSTACRTTARVTHDPLGFSGGRAPARSLAGRDPSRS